MKSNHSDHTDHDNGVVGAPVRSDDGWEGDSREARIRTRFEARPVTAQDDGDEPTDEVLDDLSDRRGDRIHRGIDERFDTRGSGVDDHSLASTFGPRGRRAGLVDGELAATGQIGSWADIKSQFVDDPAAALEAAEAMVQSALDERIRALQAEADAVCARGRDESTDATDAASTESMRTRLIRLQAYCDRLAADGGH